MLLNKTGPAALNVKNINVLLKEAEHDVNDCFNQDFEHKNINIVLVVPTVIYVDQSVNSISVILFSEISNMEPNTQMQRLQN